MLLLVYIYSVLEVPHIKLFKNAPVEYAILRRIKSKHAVALRNCHQGPVAQGVQLVRIRPLGQERPRRLHVAKGARDAQRRGAALQQRARLQLLQRSVHLGPHLQQGFDHRAGATEGGIAQRRPAGSVISRDVTQTSTLRFIFDLFDFLFGESS